MFFRLETTVGGVDLTTGRQSVHLLQTVRENT